MPPKVQGKAAPLVFQSRRLQQSPDPDAHVTQETSAVTTVDIKTQCQALYAKIEENKELLMHILFGLMAVTGLIVAYFVIKTWRTRRGRSSDLTMDETKKKGKLFDAAA